MAQQRLRFYLISIKYLSNARLLLASITNRTVQKVTF